MEDFIKKLTDLLKASFPDAQTELEAIGADRVSGFLIWDGFVGVEHIERQRTVWRLIRSELTPDEQHRIAAVLTMTSDEMSAARAS